MQKPVTIDSSKYSKQSPVTLKGQLTQLQFEVTQHSHTEAPFANGYWNFFEPGLYVDVTTGEPLFSSKDKFNSQCGWPSFSKPIVPEVVTYVEDRSHGMVRVEVRSRVGDAHLGHVFEDGPRALGGKRYCINSAAIRFIPLEAMASSGYADLMSVVADA